jgi:hypothetical protein
MIKQRGILSIGNKLYTMVMVTAIAVIASGCTSTSVNTSKNDASLDVKKECSIQANGVKNVIATANKYNAIAKKQGLEFRRLNVNNSDLIKSVEEALKTGAKTANPMHYKGKKRSKTKLDTNYAASRACRFAITALTQNAESGDTFRLSIPGDGYKY